MKSTRVYHLFLFLVPFFLLGCSAERKNIISKTYHNTTARYNSYFYAKKQIEAIEQKIDEQTENNYGKILKIFPKPDSILAKNYQEHVNETIKMAGIAIDRHKNSKWVDNSWILAGRARYYDLDFENAIETYKYVNKHGTDEDDKHEALIRLIRTFTDYEEYANAVAVSDYLNKEKLNKENRKLLFLVRAHYYQTQNDLDNMVRNLVQASELMRKRDGRARIYFIIGQIYQKLGFDSEAYNYYRMCIASNPEYEMDFHARLNMAQVTELQDNSDLKSARNVFEDLLKDRKNKEFKDKIYYEWAKFEAKQNHLNQALDYYKLSVKNSQSERQKGLAFYQQATIYYDSLHNYRMAQAYYDSTVTTLPRDEEVNFTLIDKRHEVLGDFVKHLNTIETNDSLLSLVKMDTALLRKKLTAQLQEQQEALAAENEKKTRRTASQTSGSSFYLEENTSVASSWYFDNPSAMAMGQTEFIRTWGNRPLVDYWRIGQRVEDNMSAVNRNNQQEVNETETPAPEKEYNINEEVNRLISSLPYKEEEQQNALKEIENALYQVGNIYSLSLGEKENAALRFEELLERFPGTENEPEVFYQLYLIYKDKSDQQAEHYKNELLKKYPNSKFARLVENPNYNEETNALAEHQKEIYREAYAMYDSGAYVDAMLKINDVLRNTDETYFTSYLQLLKIMIIGKTEDINRYKYELSEFIKRYPDSEVNEYAKNLLKATEEFEKNEVREKGVAYIPYFDQQHYFVIIYPAEHHLDDFFVTLEEFNRGFELLDLKASNLILNEQYTMILVTDFRNKDLALEYMQDFFESRVLTEAMPNFNLVKFVISKDNFNILYQTKALNEYLSFFDKFY